MNRWKRAGRRLARTPGYTGTCVVVLALAIGVNTSIFSVARAVLLRPLPYPDAGRLVVVSETRPEAGLDRLMTSVPTFEDWRAGAGSFDEMAVYNALGTLVYDDGDEPFRLRANVVSSPYLGMLGARLERGRGLTPEEDSGWGQHPVAVLSHGAWQRAFGADPGIVGRAVTLSGRSYTVVGVLAAGFHDLASADHPTDVWVPLSMGSHVIGYRPGENARGTRWLVALGRLAPGAALAAAEAELRLLARQLAVAHPATNGGHGVALRPLAELQLGSLRGPVLALAAAALFVLLIGCADVANLVLVRAAGRRREMAIARALGLSRLGALSEALSEAALIAAAGGALGAGLAFAVNAELRRWIPVALPRHVDLTPDLAALAVALVVAGLTAALFAVLATLARRGELARDLGAGSRDGRGASSRLQRGLVVAEVAAASVLLVGGVLMMRSFAALHATSIGFRSERLLVAKLDLEGARFARAGTRRRFGRALLDAALAIPGARSATLWGPRLPGEATWYTAVYPYGRPVEQLGDATICRRHHVGPGALTNLGIPLLAGRDFEPEDREGSEPVVVVSESLARSLWPGGDPLGRRLERWRPVDPNEQQPFEVIGVAADVEHSGRRRPTDNPRDVYFAWLQVPRQELILLVRSGIEPAALVPALREATRSVDPALPLYDVTTMEERLAADEEPVRFAATLMGLYALLAAGLASLGIYGVIACAVGRRTREMGVRIALGAMGRDLLKLVTRDAGRLVALGLALGSVTAWAMAGWLESLLYGVSAREPAVFAAVAVALGAVGMAAALLPAARAGRVDPVRALRS